LRWRKEKKEGKTEKRRDEESTIQPRKGRRKAEGQPRNAKKLN